VVVALYNAAVEKWKQRLVFQVIVVYNFFFFIPLEWNTRKDRNINLNKYSQSEFRQV